ncbi:MAG: hypothetical protein COV45_02190 [Deltaproteobacteria bacterium CG11_big_fil_rev_8_21_14_0_20_47_16]|nr:MAG: hypothetical protein COV45_02190 [Deltaproteobacteria bacterium CG11_big_fil_rev_8_21_14_0_20_47_16]
MLGLVLLSLMVPMPAMAKKSRIGKTISNATLSATFVDMKSKSSWVTVTIALENMGDAEATFECCKAFLENADGLSVASLTQDEVQRLVHNKAKTAALIGTIAGAGLGIAGAVDRSAELGYAAVSVAGASTIAGAVAEASADSQRRNIVIDDVMRAKIFYPGIKVAGSMWFPSKKHWHGSKKIQAIHVVYAYNGKMQELTIPVNSK